VMSRRKVLLIDDEDDIREVATITRETMAGYGGHGAGDSRFPSGPLTQLISRKNDVGHTIVRTGCW